jgi:hypothetical protein
MLPPLGENLQLINRQKQIFKLKIFIYNLQVTSYNLQVTCDKLQLSHYTPIDLNQTKNAFDLQM